MKKFNRALTINIEDSETSHQQHENHYFQFKEGYEDSGDEKSKLDASQNRKVQVVEFQEFNAQNTQKTEEEEEYDFKKQIPTPQIIEPKQTKTLQQFKEARKHMNKRKFDIEIPQQEYVPADNQQTAENGRDTNRRKKFSESFKETQIREPPAPVNRLVKNIKAFCFPEYDLPRNQLNEADDIQKMEAAFDKERQQFYKQRSRLEKLLLVKDGQIEMLQKIVMDRYSAKDNSASQRSYQKTNKIQEFILQKDIQINDLLQKISSLNEQLEFKNEQLITQKTDNFKLDSLVESLRNQLYLLERKEAIQQLNKEFPLVQKRRSTPRQRDEASFPKYGNRECVNLQRRLETLKMNRIQLQNRGKIKSQLSYSMTTKNKNKEIFDFQGRLYDHSYN